MPQRIPYRSALVAILLCFCSSSVIAAELRAFHFYSKTPGLPNISIIQLVGAITEGDTEELDRLVREANEVNSAVVRLELYSSGGLLAEGLALGRKARQYALRTDAPFYSKNTKTGICLHTNGQIAAPSGFAKIPLYDYRSIAPKPPEDQHCVCASACAYAWLGGVVREGSVGVHRSRLLQSDKELSFLEMESSLARSDRVLMNFLSEMRLPSVLFDRINASASTEIEVINPIDLETPIEEWVGRDPIFKEYILSQCGDGLNDEEEELYWTIFLIPGAERNLTEKLAFQALSDRKSDIEACEFRSHIEATAEAQKVHMRLGE